MSRNDQLISARIWWEAELKVLADRRKREREHAKKNVPPNDFQKR